MSKCKIQRAENEYSAVVQIGSVCKSSLCSSENSFMMNLKNLKLYFVLGEKQGMLVDDECNPWHNRVGDFLLLFWDRTNEFV